MIRVTGDENERERRENLYEIEKMNKMCFRSLEKIFRKKKIDLRVKYTDSLLMFIEALKSPKLLFYSSLTFKIRPKMIFFPISFEFLNQLVSRYFLKICIKSQKKMQYLVAICEVITLKINYSGRADKSCFQLKLL